MRVLVVNAGSSSLKLSSLRRDDDAVHGWVAERDGEDLPALLDGLEGPVDAVGHRFVHGGTRTEAAVVDDGVAAELERLVPLVPLHQPAALHGVRRCAEALPEVPQVACFDSAFHTTIPDAARTYALPRDVREPSDAPAVRVVGFHGLAHAWAARRAAELVPSARRVVVAHLGSGASLCGVRDGRSVVTTMGLTPLDGLVMGTRSGALDPGAVLELVRRHGREEAERLLWSASGLLGLAGTSDAREVARAAADGDPDAVLARDVTAERLLQETGRVVASLGGLDALVFSGGVGENDAEVRRRLCQGLAFLGVGEPAAAPAAQVGDDGDGLLSAPGDDVAVLRVHAREDVQVADEVAGVLGGGAARGPRPEGGGPRAVGGPG